MIVQNAEEQIAVGIGHTYAEPLWGLRVSWGSVLAGAVATIAVSLILWSLALAIVSLGTNGTEGSMRASAAALWICAMATTLIGAFVGGYLAGYLPGSTRTAIFRAHGFLSWCVAFLVAFLFCLGLLRSTAFMVETGAHTRTTAAVQPTEAVTFVRAAGSGPAPSTEATLPPALDPDPVGPGYRSGPGDPYSQNDPAIGRMLKESLVGMSWSWFGTWIVALGLSIAGASLGARRLTMADKKSSSLG